MLFYVCAMTLATPRNYVHKSEIEITLFIFVSYGDSMKPVFIYHLEDSFEKVSYHGLHIFYCVCFSFNIYKQNYLTSFSSYSIQWQTDFYMREIIETSFLLVPVKYSHFAQNVNLHQASMFVQMPNEVLTGWCPLVQ